MGRFFRASWAQSLNMYGLIRRSSFRDSVSALGQAVLDSRFLETDIMVSCGCQNFPRTDNNPGRPLGYFIFSLIGLSRTLFTNIFQRL